MEIEPGTEINGNPAIMNRGKIITKLGPRQELGGNIITISPGTSVCISNSRGR